MKVALLSLGNLGIEIAGVLLRTEHQLTVYNRTAEKARFLQSEGAHFVSNPREAATNSNIVLTCVFDDTAFEQVTFGPDGVLAGLSEGTVHAGLSTISIGLAKRLEKEHADLGRSYIGAPVFGLPQAACEGQLLIMTAGTPAAIEKAQPVFDAIGRGTFNAGPEAWQAHLFKIAGNFILSGMVETLSEAISTLRQSGVDANEFVRVFDELVPNIHNYGTALASGRHDPPAWALRLGLKDNGLMLDAGRELALPLPVARFMREQRIAAIEAKEARRAMPAA